MIPYVNKTHIQKQYDKYLKWFLEAKSFEKKSMYYKQLLMLKQILLKENQRTR